MTGQYISRTVSSKLSSKVAANKVLVLYGARRVGKTELIRKYLSGKQSSDYLLLNGEDVQALKLLEERSISNYRRLLGDVRLLVIDEAQKIPEIGLKLKLMVDEIPTKTGCFSHSKAVDHDAILGQILGEQS